MKLQVGNIYLHLGLQEYLERLTFIFEHITGER